MTDKPPRCHLRIEKNANREPAPGLPHVVTYDRVTAVGADGAEVEISGAVTAWREISNVGEARRLEVTLFGFYIANAEGEILLDNQVDDQKRNAGIAPDGARRVRDPEIPGRSSGPSS